MSDTSKVSDMYVYFVNSIMQFSEGALYHIYNRGNNQQPIFFSRDNYFYFLEKVNRYVASRADLLAWCLMPNHFHLLVHATKDTCTLVKEQPIQINALTEGIRLLLSSYSKGIQKQQGFTGNLFQQKTKSKCVEDGSERYGETAFHNIHQNPLKAGLVANMEDWEFSSFLDYAGLRNGQLCKKELALQWFDLSGKDFIKTSCQLVPEETAQNIF